MLWRSQNQNYLCKKKKKNPFPDDKPSVSFEAWRSFTTSKNTKSRVDLIYYLMWTLERKTSKMTLSPLSKLCHEKPNIVNSYERSRAAFWSWAIHHQSWGTEYSPLCLSHARWQVRIFITEDLRHELLALHLHLTSEFEFSSLLLQKVNACVSCRQLKGETLFFNVESGH